MIDIQKAKLELKNYLKNYNPENKKIKLKISHIQRTSRIARNIATSLKLEQEDIDLAELIGLLHDIGRFEQIKRYNTFIDKNSINHGEFGVKLLFEDNLIEKFIQDRQYDKIIEKAILNHNRNQKDIDKNLDERQLLHTKIIRDADKTDILYILTFEDKLTAWEKADLSDEKISDEIYREYIEEKSIKYKERKTSADTLVSHFAYIFNFYFKAGLEIVKNEEYIDKIYKRFTFNDKETMDRYITIYNQAKAYLNNI